MDTTQVCPVCGKPVVSGAPHGLCPECLMKSGFETKAGNEPGAGKPAFVPPSVEEMTKLFPQLEIIELLGQGGMGAVYKARQPRLNRLVALKILSPEKQNDPQFAERFQREARALAWLTHPNIVTVYDFGEVQGHFYLLMEFVDGMTLRALMQTRRLASAEALVIVPQICQALQYAHEQGIVHRDIKPENILLDKKGQVKIADFGIAKILDQPPQDISLTGAKDVVGTPYYMAPEQLEKPQTVDHRADIYSLGVVFYEMLTGELPLGNFRPPSQKVQIDVRLDEVVLHAMEKEPERRYQKASEVKTAVETIAGTAAPAGKAEMFAQAILAGDYTLDIGSCLSRGWALVRSDFWPVVGVTALILLLRSAADSALVGVVAGGPLMGGLCLYFLKKIRGEPASVGTAFSGFSIAFLPLFLASLVKTLLTAAGFFCLILPGIYLMVAWTFTLALVIDKRLGFWPAMGLSRKIVSKHWWKFFGFIIVLSLIKMAGMLVFFAGYLVVAPVALAALMFAYEDIFGAKKEPADVPSPVPPVAAIAPQATGTSRGWKIAAAFLAIVAALILLFVFIVFISHEKAPVNPSPPKVVALTPANGATNVDPGLTEIRVVFDQPMLSSWSMIGGGPRFPELAGKCHYDAASTTWSIPVKLKPNWTYEFGLNSKSHKNFKSEQGVPLEPVRVTFRTTDQPAPAIATTDLAGSNAFWNLLNEDQRLVVQWTDDHFHNYFDARTFDGWSNQERSDLERRLIDTLKGPQINGSQKSEYFQAINTLAALHSTRALPELRKIAFYHPDKLLRAEISNRGRWMAARALGMMGDKQSAPELVHLLYHNNANTRWWAQISLVRLTGQNFGKDWKAWGNWWNSHNEQPPFSTDIIRWWNGQAEPDQLMESLAESDRKFFENISGKNFGATTSRIDDTFWLNLDRKNYPHYREELQKAPHMLVVRPTHYDLNQLSHTGIGMHYGWIDGKLANLCVSFSELVSYAHTKQAVWDPHLMVRTEFPQEWHDGQLTNQFDVIDTLRVQPVERLQAYINQQLKEQFGLAWHRETRDTEVLLIKVKDSQLLESKINRVFANSRSLSELAGDWENYFGKPVLDETGLTNRYDRKLGLIPAAYVPNRTKDLDANNAFLAPYGLELVPSHRPMEWLALERTPTEIIKQIRLPFQQLPAEITAAMNTNDFERAQSLAGEATQLNPLFVEGWVADGMASARLEQFDRAQQAYERALSLYQGRSRDNPSDANSVLQQIFLLTLLDRSAEAGTLLESAQKSYPDDDQLAALARHFSEVKSGWTHWMVKTE